MEYAHPKASILKAAGSSSIMSDCGAAITHYVRNARPAGDWCRPPRKSRQGAPIFTHPLHHPANATLFPAKSVQEPIESLVF
jgi:hypothetical protein